MKNRALVFVGNELLMDFNFDHYKFDNGSHYFYVEKENERYWSIIGIVPQSHAVQILEIE